MKCTYMSGIAFDCPVALSQEMVFANNSFGAPILRINIVVHIRRHF